MGALLWEVAVRETVETERVRGGREIGEFALLSQCTYLLTHLAT